MPTPLALQQGLLPHRAWLRPDRLFRHAVTIGLALGIVFAFSLRCLAAGADPLDQSAERLLSNYREDLAELAEWCDAEGLAKQADITRRSLYPQDPVKLFIAVLPKQIGATAEPPAGADAKVAEWHQRLRRLRHEQADALFDLARRAIVGHRASLAIDLVLAALHENPDHAACRRLFGFQPYQGQWCTAYEVQKLRNGFVWHEKFGWLDRTYVVRYEQGMRHVRGRWITAEEESRLRSSIQTGWDIETDHYIVRTSHSLEAGVDLAQKLEQLYLVWKQLFVRYFMTEKQVGELFAGRGSGRNGMPRHSVVYFRNRDEYVQSLRSAIPSVGISVGVYVESTKRAYFFAGDESDDHTLLHEATHQLFHESRRVAPTAGRNANFWIIEGIAMYMETLREEQGFHVLGGWDDARIQAARYRLLHDGFYVPLSEFTGYGMEKLQRDPRIATLYSQAAGLTHFLIHYDHGRYRDALVDYLFTIYRGVDRPDLLVRLTGSSFGELDRQYREYMEAAPPVVATGP